MDRKDEETKGRHIKEANKEKKSAGGNLQLSLFSPFYFIFTH